MQSLLKEIRNNPLLWLLVVVPIVLVTEKAAPEAHTILFRSEEHTSELQSP